MQEKKRETKTVRIEQKLIDTIEKIAITESNERGELMTIPQMVDELLHEAINNRGEEPGKSE